jgi:acyl-CoA thioester hydrolase
MTPVSPPATRIHTLEFDVQVFDTDCFGVMWHGAYIKWLEMGRVRLLESMGVSLSRPGDPDGFIYPVVEQSLKFKARAPYAEPLLLTTGVTVEGVRLVFGQTVRSRTDQRVMLDAVTTVLVLDTDWKVQRRLPAFLRDALSPSGRL